MDLDPAPRSHAPSSPDPRPLLAVRESGVRRPGRPVAVLLHGVGVGPQVMAATARLLSFTMEVAVVDRPGYGSLAGEAPAPLGAQVDRLAATLRRTAARSDARPLLVGVSGGATLGLALLLRHPDLLEAAVLHEPLLGPLAPALHVGVASRAGRLATTPGPDATCEFVADLIGAAAWQSLTYQQRDEVAAADALVRAEVAAFAGFAPTLAQLQALRGAQVHLVTTVGARSGPARHEAAAVLAATTGAELVVLPRCGHLAPLDAAVELVGLVRTVAAGEAATASAGPTPTAGACGGPVPPGADPATGTAGARGTTAPVAHATAPGVRA